MTFAHGRRRARVVHCALISAAGWILAGRLAFGQDGGAASFDGARRIYREPARTWQPEDIPLPPAPPRPVDAAPEEAAADSGPTFAISEFEVTGDTLLGLGEIERTLAPFKGAGRSFSTVEKARRALEARYSSKGFLTAGVMIPPQSIEGGVVQLRVIEARVAAVEVQNDGYQWVDKARVEALVPHLKPGALLREDELREDLVRANSEPDLSVRPVMAAGATPGTINLKLVVDDQAPVHGGIDLYNQHTAGSPRRRALARLSYGDLWKAHHSLSMYYGFTPSYLFSDLSVLGVGYSVPDVWMEGDRISASYSYSSSRNGIPNFPALTSIGDGLSFGMRYEVPLPELSSSHSGFVLIQGLNFGIDVKKIGSTVQFEGFRQQDLFAEPDDGAADPNTPTGEPEKPESISSSDKRPIRYRPMSVEYWLRYTGHHSQSSLSLQGKLGLAGFLGGADKDQFRFVRGDSKPDSPITGNYEVLAWDLTHTMRVSSVLRALSAGRLQLDPRTNQPALDQDWNLTLRSFGQLASEPLIPTEQMPGSGLRSVRGYLEAEIFGDSAWGLQAEAVSRPFSVALGGRILGSVRGLVFYDDMEFLNLRPAGGQRERRRIYSVGLGLRGNWWGGRMTSEFVVGWPLVDTDNTGKDRPRLDVRLGYGF